MAVGRGICSRGRVRSAATFLPLCQTADVSSRSKTSRRPFRRRLTWCLVEFHDLQRTLIWPPEPTRRPII
jgi:hypothetical protein